MGKQHACRVDSNKKCNEECVDREREREQDEIKGFGVVHGLSQSGRRWVASVSAC
jgi:hypothetical protein